MALETANLKDLSLEDLLCKDLTERQINELDPQTRLEFLISKLKNKNAESSVSERFDAIIILAELYHRLQEGDYNSEFSIKQINKMYCKIIYIFKWAIDNEPNCVPHHELSYQIAARDMRELIPEMVQTTLKHKSIISKHEYLENLANISAWRELEAILPIALKDHNPDIRATAEYCADRMRRYKDEPLWVH